MVSWRGLALNRSSGKDYSTFCGGMITGMARGATGSTLVNSSVRAVGELAVVDPPVRAIVIAGR